MKSIWIAESNVYADSEGKVCQEYSPNCHKVLIGVGESVPMRRAIELGLCQGSATEQLEETNPFEGQESEGSDYSLMTKADLLEVLAGRGMDADPKEKKDVLVKLCENSEPLAVRSEEA